MGSMYLCETRSPLEMEEPQFKAGYSLRGAGERLKDRDLKNIGAKLIHEWIIPEGMNVKQCERLCLQKLRVTQTPLRSIDTETFTGDPNEIKNTMHVIITDFIGQVDPTKYIGTKICRTGEVVDFRDPYWVVEYECGKRTEFTEEEVLKSRVLVRRSTRQNNLNRI